MISTIRAASFFNLSNHRSVNKRSIYCDVNPFHATAQPTFTRSKSTIRNIRKVCETYSKLTIKTLERPFELIWRRSAVFIVNFEHILHIFLVSELLTLNK